MTTLSPHFDHTRGAPPAGTTAACEAEAHAGQPDAYHQLQRYAHDLQQTLRAREDAYRQLFAYTQDLQSVIRQRNSALAEARVAAVAKSRLIANMSHEFRTPLTVILGFTELLAGTTRDAGQKDLFSRILAAGSRVEGLVANLLTLARLDTGALPVRAESFDVCALLRQDSAAFAERARAKGVEFELKVPDHPVAMEMDAAHLRQALAALLDNAVKFTPRGRIEVTLHTNRQTAAPLRIDIADTGIGIPAEHHQRIMESFEQVDGSSTRAFDGAGLGLTVARSILALVGCQLELASSAGNGSVFSIVLPPGSGALPARPL